MLEHKHQIRGYGPQWQHSGLSMERYVKESPCKFHHTRDLDLARNAESVPVIAIKSFPNNADLQLHGVISEPGPHKVLIPQINTQFPPLSLSMRVFVCVLILLNPNSPSLTI